MHCTQSACRFAAAKALCVPARLAGKRETVMAVHELQMHSLGDGGLLLGYMFLLIYR